MNKPSLSLLAAVLLGAVFVLGAIGNATAGDGQSCGGKKKDGGTALVVTPEMPRA